MNNVLARFAFISVGIFLVFMVGAAGADTLVQFNLNYSVNGSSGPVTSYLVQLFDQQAPITVSNFLSYVTSLDYNGSMIHRDAHNYPNIYPYLSWDHFVVQGGGYIPYVYNNQIYVDPIASHGTITNEFSPTRSNVRGTIAMAKGDNPNSATSEWFVNVVDNSSNLDNQNGGFTVFGQVVGEGMKLIDAVDNLQIYNYGGAFNQLPLKNNSLTMNNLIIVTSATVIPTIDWKGGSGSGPTNWDLAANWNPSTSAPNSPGSKISFGNQTSNNVVNMVSANRTVGNLFFSATHSTTIQSTTGKILTLDNSGSPSTIGVAGSHIISAPVLLNNDVNISGIGTLDLSGGVSGSHAMNVLGGEVTASSIRVNTLCIGAGAKVVIQPRTGNGPQGGQITPIPEPSTIVSLCIGAISLLAYGLQRRKRAV